MYKYTDVFEMCESLSEDFKNKSQKIYHKYHPIEKNTQMTVAQKSPWVAEWWRQSELSLHGIQFNYQDIEKSIKKSNLKLRYVFETIINKKYITVRSRQISRHNLYF